MASHLLLHCFLCLSFIVALPCHSADLVAAWDRGWSDLELYVSANSHEATTLSTVLGFGLASGLSIGLSFVEGEDDGDDIGLIAVVTRPIGRDLEIDAWIELGQRLRPREAELTSACLTAGLELSRRLQYAVHYLRLSGSRDDGVTSLHPLVGVMIPFERMVELHVELSSEQPEEGPWPLHVVVGPNVRLGHGAKLLPELSWIRFGKGESAWGASLGIVLDPSRLWR